MYDNRVEIYSPGGMYDGSYVQNLDTDMVPSRRRNPIIADVFNRMHYMERRGSGFKKIKDDCANETNYKKSLEPKFYSDNSSFWVTLYNLNYDVVISKSTDKKVAIKSGDKKAAIKSGDKSKEQKERILQYLQKEKVCRTVNIGELLNVKNSRAKKLISELVIEGRIMAEGANKNRTYCLKEK